jgi:hypothetical protein
MDSSDWANWAIVFRAGGREAATAASRAADPGAFVMNCLARSLHEMGDRCSEIAEDLREAGR